MLSPTRLRSLRDHYRRGLHEDVLPFWLRHAVDHEHGGFVTSLDRDGSWIDDDKGMWQQGRFAWLLATLAHDLPESEAREDWLELAKSGVLFLWQHGFDADGRMFFHVTREGKPLRKRRYLFTETFATIAFAAYSRAAGDRSCGTVAQDLYRGVLYLWRNPHLLPAKFVAGTRPAKSIGYPMILLATSQVLRETLEDPLATECIDTCIDEIRRDFVNEKEGAVLETVGLSGEVLDHFDGRLLNPGHAIEAAWFILHESRTRGGDEELTALGLRMLDWMWERGWDKEYGGLFYFRDLHGKPVQEYWHDMKFWWPHCELLIASLLAYQLTREERYASMFLEVHEYAHAAFPDEEFGEWYGYLHRDGRVSVPLKGNLWKGPFHIPRMQHLCARILGELADESEAASRLPGDA